MYYPSRSPQRVHAGVAVAAQPLIAHHNRPPVTARANSVAPICFYFGISLLHSRRFALPGGARGERSRNRSGNAESYGILARRRDKAEQAGGDDEEDVHGEHRYDNLQVGAEYCADPEQIASVGAA